LKRGKQPQNIFLRALIQKTLDKHLLPKQAAVSSRTSTKKNKMKMKREQGVEVKKQKSGNKK
tara:strand:+ start:140 stop:325 length:186 start_codon:yes stop_codon:yes gene_type:complete